MARGDGGRWQSSSCCWEAPRALPAALEDGERSSSSSAGEGGGGGGGGGGPASVNVLSLGFAATAILLSLFLLMALFERFLRPSSPSPPPPPPLLHPAIHSATSSSSSSAKPRPQPAFASDLFAGVSVLMPGHSIPTFIGNPLPLPARQCPPIQNVSSSIQFAEPQSICPDLARASASSSCFAPLS